MLTPPEIAKQLRIGNRKVIGWIKSGRLPAINVATDMCRRPLYRVKESDLEGFLAGRKAAEPKVARRIKYAEPGDIKFV